MRVVHMKVEGKDLFTIKSINNGKPELKDEKRQAINHIEYLMRLHGIRKVSL